MGGWVRWYAQVVVDISFLEVPLVAVGRRRGQGVLGATGPDFGCAAKSICPGRENFGVAVAVNINNGDKALPLGRIKSVDARQFAAVTAINNMQPAGSVIAPHEVEGAVPVGIEGGKMVAVMKDGV